MHHSRSGYAGLAGWPSLDSPKAAWSSFASWKKSHEASIQSFRLHLQSLLLILYGILVILGMLMTLLTLV